MNENRNLILATILSMLVMLAWLLLFPAEAPTPASDAPDGAQAPAATPAPTASARGTSTPGTSASGNAPNTVADSRAAALADAPRVEIDTPRLEGSLSLLGGRIDDLALKDYRETQDENADIVTLLSPEGSANPYFALHGWAVAHGVAPTDVPGATTLWTLTQGQALTPETPVTLTWDNGKGQIFTRTISVDQDFMFQISQSVQNTGVNEVAIAPYGLIARYGEPPNLMGFFILHEGLVRMSDGSLDETDYDNMPDYDPVAREGGPADVVQVEEKGWIGFTDHYWMSTLIPSGAFKSVAKYDEARDIYQTEAVQPTQTIAPGAAVTVTSQFFAGAKEWEAIRTYENAGVDRFVDSIDWGWFWFLTKPIFQLLHWLNSVIGNMGWSIIALTLILKAILFPLAYKSYVSMARMKELQPEMEKLKENAGDDRQKLQQGMMEMYRKHKVNPAAGCLPILPQIPIFFSLYKVIFVTLEVRHAPWFGPFQDLSAPDPTSIMNLFGLLPFDGPGAGSILALVLIGILPLLLGISMWMQQKLNPAPTDPMQATIFAWMPWVFMFMLGGFASGLVIYWIANNTITFTQQYIIMRSQGVKPDVFGNIMSTFKKKKE